MKEKQLSEAQKEAVLQLERHDEIDLKDMSDKTSGMPDFLMWNGILRLAGGSTPSYFAAGLDVDTPKMLWRTVVNNSLTLVTSTFDALGIALDPLLCAANHSCAPNALVVFDGPRVSLRSLVPIAPDEEVFIAYVDTTNPFSMRQVELKERFHFTCACSKCRLGPTLPEDRFLRPANELEKKWDKLGGKCYEDHPFQRTLDIISDPLSTSGDWRQSKAWPSTISRKGKAANSKMFAITRQPYPALRQELFVRMLSEGNYGIAFLQAAKTYFKIDPVLYPQRFHPVRVVHTWTLLMLMVYMLQNYEDPHSVQLLGAGFDFVTVIWRLINEVKDLVPKSHGKSQFKDGVEAKYNEIRSEMMRGEGYIKRLEEGIDTQWRRFVAFADALEY
ncbi:hypothetical protein H2203_000057 [Taxawa tesnikishii (nom. ined.)]|nr:hypothetical protein H2203_000057 [Dothideales sp. JES 119]